MSTFLTNCPKCGRMFASAPGQKFCSKCSDQDEELFKIVREYIYDNPGSNIKDVAEATEVSEEKILKFLRQGKLELKGEGVGYECDSCGKTITSGRYCEACALKLQKEMKSAFGVQDNKPEIDIKSSRTIKSDKMYTKK